MIPPKSWLPLVVFFVCAYIFSWIVFILLALNHHGIIYLFPDDAAHARVQDAWHSIGGLGPGIAALICFALFKKSSFKKFLRSWRFKRITGAGWFISLSPFIYLAIAIMINRVIDNEWFNPARFFKEQHLLSPLNLLAWLLPSLTYGFGEEAGWRGFALPFLQRKYSAFIASSILALFWFGWHVPSFWYRYDLNLPSMLGLAMGIWAGSVWITFIYNFTRGSLLAVGVWHFTWDVVSMIGKQGMIAAIMSIVIMILAVVVVIRYGTANLSPHPKVVMDDSIT
ncbi:MAG TPA: CPBP family intramembrane glutamic endopeptidase [Chitinophagaceae bacterium]|nr:CPBP family intramembrane glutamic endopeptidase [Chitinophagaceae bacterium]